MKIVINALPISSGMTGIGTYTSELVECTSQFIDNHNFFYLVSREYNTKKDRNRYLVIDQPSYYWEQLQMPSDLKYWEIDIYHSSLFTCPVIDEFANVITIHDVIPITRPNLCSDEFLRFFEKHVGSSIRSALKIITTSEYSKQEIIKHFGVVQSDIEVLYQSISPEFSPCSEQEIHSVKQKYKLPGNYILSVGMIEPRKNIEFLCEVISQIKDVNLVLVGRKDDPDYPIEKIITSLGIQERVFILGYVAQQDLPALYSGARIFAFLSLYEGFGRPIVEAMACGTVVVSSNVTCLPEIAGQAALYVDPQNLEEARQGIEQLWHSPQKINNLVSRGFEQAKKYTRESFAKQLNCFYSNLRF